MNTRKNTKKDGHWRLDNKITRPFRHYGHYPLEFFGSVSSVKLISASGRSSEWCPLIVTLFLLISTYGQSRVVVPRFLFQSIRFVSWWPSLNHPLLLPPLTWPSVDCQGFFFLGQQDGRSFTSGVTFLPPLWEQGQTSIWLKRINALEITWLQYI